MSKSLLAYASTASAGSGQFVQLGGSTANSTEANTQITARVAGTFSGLSCNVDATGSSRVIRFRKNGANGSQVVSPTNTTAGLYTDGSNSDAVTAGDTFTLSNAISTTIYSAKLLFTAASGHAVYHSASSGGNSISNNGTSSYVHIGGALSPNNTEANRKCRMRVAGTLTGAQVYISANARTTTSTLKSRINGADGTIAISIAAGATGVFEDTTHTDTLNAGDDLCWAFVMGASAEALTVFRVACMVTHSVAKNDLFSCGGNNFAGGNTRYLALCGNTSGATVEANANIQHGFSANITRLRALVQANSCTTAVVFQLRKNSADATQSISVTASTTGLFEDVTNTDSYVATDDCCIKQSGGTSGTLTFAWVGVTEEDASSAVYTQTVSATTSPLASRILGAARTVSVSTADTASVVRSTGKEIDTTSSPLSALVRSASKVLAPSASPAASLARAVAKTILKATNPAASIIKATAKIAFAASASALASLVIGRAYARAVAASASAAASLRRSTGKLVVAATSPTTSLRRAVSKVIAASSSAVATVLRVTAGQFTRLVLFIRRRRT